MFPLGTRFYPTDNASKSMHWCVSVQVCAHACMPVCFCVSVCAYGTFSHKWKIQESPKQRKGPQFGITSAALWCLSVPTNFRGREWFPASQGSLQKSEWKTEESQENGLYTLLSNPGGGSWVTFQPRAKEIVSTYLINKDPCASSRFLTPGWEGG